MPHGYVIGAVVGLHLLVNASYIFQLNTLFYACMLFISFKYLCTLKKIIFSFDVFNVDFLMFLKHRLHNLSKWRVKNGSI